MRLKKKKITPKEMLSSNKCGLQKHALPECIQPNKRGWNVFVGSLFFCQRKSGSITKLSRIHPLGTINVIQ